MGEFMDMTALPLEMLGELLDQFSSSTGDYYLFYDHKADLFHFSSNIHEIFSAMPQDANSCTSRVWRSVVYPMDLPRVNMITEELVGGLRECYNLNYRIRNRHGQYIWINSRGKAYSNPGGKPYILGRVSKQLAFAPDSEVRRPALTRELNRIYAEGRDGFVVVIGVDDLRRINLKQGREFGDAVIKTLEESMSAGNAGECLAFRINGDCFCAILPEATQDEVVAFFEKTQENMREQCTVSGGGVSLRTYQVPEGSVLLQYAESALETSKRNGKAQLSFFSPGDYERKLMAVELLEELETAVRQDFQGFSICYQAQVRSESFEIFGAEALLRFQSPSRGAVSPQEFIPLLEESELIYPVGLWVIRNVLDQCRIWRETIPDFHVSINMSYVQLCRAEVQEDVLGIFRASGLPGSALTLEVTESMELQDYPHLNTVFSAWKKEGIEISVDDFGTGYSSLRWLKELAVDEIKIDGCFVREIQHSSYNLRLLSNIIELADSCQIRICCEGVETRDELAVLERLHPGIYQGYLFAKPCPPDEFFHNCLNWEEHVSKIRGGSPTFSRSNPGIRQRLPVDTAELEHSILEMTEDILSVCDLDTHEIYYLNPAGQRLFGIRDYQGRKCYKVFYGRDTPCECCPNEHLRQDSFHVWENWNEYCQRRFLFKEKLAYIGERRLRIKVGIDITKQEYTSRALQERLKLSDKVVGYVDAVRAQRDYESAVEQLLACVGDFHQAKGVYFFQHTDSDREQWENTICWESSGSTSRSEDGPRVASAALPRWMGAFRKNESIMIYHLDPLKKEFPREYEVLRARDVHRLIAVPILERGKVYAFIAVANPRASIQNDSMIRVLAAFVSEKYPASDSDSGQTQA